MAMLNYQRVYVYAHPPHQGLSFFYFIDCFHYKGFSMANCYNVGPPSYKLVYKPHKL